MNKINLILKIAVITSVVLLFNSCAPSRIVRPLDKGQKAISANFGGPLMGFAGTTIPMPLTSIVYAQGVTDNATVFGSVHSTALLFGVLQTDIGVCYSPYYNDSLRLGVSITPALNVAVDTWEGNFKLWPQVDVNVYWDIKPKKSYIYAGIDNWFELSSTRAHGEAQQNRWLFNTQLGFTHVREKWDYNFEAKYLLPYLENEPNVVKYRGISGKGAIGLYFTLTRKF